MQSVTARMPLLMATSSVRLWRRRWSSPQPCHLHCLCAIIIPKQSINSKWNHTPNAKKLLQICQINYRIILTADSPLIFFLHEFQNRTIGKLTGIYKWNVPPILSQQQPSTTRNAMTGTTTKTTHKPYQALIQQLTLKGRDDAPFMQSVQHQNPTMYAVF